MKTLTQMLEQTRWDVAQPYENEIRLLKGEIEVANEKIEYLKKEITSRKEKIKQLEADMKVAVKRTPKTK